MQGRYSGNTQEKGKLVRGQTTGPAGHSTSPVAGNTPRRKEIRAMKTIYKYPVEVTNEQEILMPRAARILSVDTQR